MWNQKTSVQILLEIIKKGFDTYNYEVKRPLPIGKNEKKDWLDEGWVGWRNNERVIRREIKL